MVFFFFLGLGIVLIVHFHFLIGLLLFVQFLIVLLDSQLFILEIGLAVLSIHAHSAPPCKKDEFCAQGLVLQQLHYIEFVVVALDVGLVESGREGPV